MDPIVLASLISTLILLIPGVILFLQFTYTKIKTYLLFSSFFWMNGLGYIFIAIGDLSDGYDSSVSETTYVVAAKGLQILNLLGWFIFFYLGYTSIWPKGKRIVLWIFTIFGSFIFVNIMLMELQPIPSSSTILGISLHSTMEGIGVLTEIFPGFYFGQGHLLITILWNLSCTTVFGYSFLIMDNKLNYPPFKKVRNSWLFFILFFVISQLLVISSLLSDLIIFLSLAQLTQFISIFGLIYVAIIFPEGLLLDRVQLLKAIKLIDRVQIDDGIPGVKIGKVLDYIEYIQSNMENIQNETTSISD